MKVAVVVESIWLRLRLEKVEEENCDERVWIREEEGTHECAIHLCCLLLLGSAVKLVSWWR